ncbi:MAG: hypothetical protein HY825_20075 [Acidobacteria bacterium]|nr:hypothetical protein [Acidobacteriota bacterium]
MAGLIDPGGSLGEAFRALLCLVGIASCRLAYDEATRKAADEASEREDRELFAKCRLGDAEAYFALFKKHHGFYSAICRAFFRPSVMDVETEMEDVLIIATERGWRHINSINNPQAYLAVIVRNLCIDKVREVQTEIKRWGTRLQPGEDGVDPVTNVPDPITMEEKIAKRQTEAEENQAETQAEAQAQRRLQRLKKENERYFWAIVLTNNKKNSQQMAADILPSLLETGGTTPREACTVQDIKNWKFRGKKRLFAMEQEERS